MNTVTVQYLGYNHELGAFTCTVFKGDLNDANGVLIDDHNKERLQRKAIAKVRQMAGGDVQLVTKRKWESVFRRVK